MTNPSPDTSTQEQILATFVLELETAFDREAVVVDYARRYSLLANEFKELARAQTQVQLAFPRSDVTQSRHFSIGERLGEFEIVDLIAVGGMGEVYTARQPRLNRTVALKVVRRGRTDSDARRRFDREQRVLAKLHQSHIVPIHTAGENGEVLYFTMAYIRGAALNRVVETVYEIETSGSGNTPSLRELAKTSPSMASAPLTKRRDGVKQVHLSKDYFLSVAEVMAQAAEAVQYAHDVGVIHRDIKPSNLMVDPDGHCWIIDFGLAGLRNREESAIETTKADGLTCGPMGTPQYMAPEQYDGKSVFASDIWGLGATLYELLTLRRAFDGPTYQAIEEQVRTTSPRKVRELVTNVPKDLAAICAKAMAKESSNRYATAGEMVTDLRRWLNREPTKARPAWVFRRVGLWSIRNKGWATAIACSIIAAIILGVLSNIAAKELAVANDARANEAEDKLKEQERGSTLLRAADVRASIRRNGWSEQAWDLAVDAHRRRPGADSRDEAACSLIGMDAKLVKRRDSKIAGTGASGIAFSPDGNVLLVGGKGGEPTWLWNKTTGEEKLFHISSEGPVGFRPDGKAIQVILPTNGHKTIQFWDLIAGKSVREFGVEDAVTMAELSTDTSLLAVATRNEITVWDTDAGNCVRRIVVMNTVGLAFTPDGKLLAVGNSEGNVGFWPLPDGSPLPPLTCGRNPVRALSFGRSMSSPQLVKKSESNWRLATGDDGGLVTVWELASRSAVAFCRGSQYEVYAVAFSPDGMHLASAGRFETKIWDAATGRQLSNLLPTPKFRDHITRLQFSPNGTYLAVGSLQQPKVMGGADVWELQNGRGVRTLCGLRTNITRMALSVDGKRVAALSHDWKLAVWDIEQSRLLHVFDTPHGLSADNAALTFSPDGKRFAFSTGSEAVLWNLSNGEVIDRWKNLPLGLTDAIAFHTDGKVYLFRTEVVDGQVPPLSNYPPEKFPRHALIRELKPGGKVSIIGKPLSDFPKGGRKVVASHEGGFFAVKWWGETEMTQDVVRVYDSATGKIIWPGCANGFDFIIDGSGKSIHVFFGEGKSSSAFEIPSGKRSGVRKVVGTILCTSGEFTAAVIEDTERGDRSLTISRTETNKRLVTFDVGVRIRHDGWGGFTSDGHRIVWANEDGTVMVCELPEVNRRLTNIGSGWEN